jgi:glycosyltransferase involved in cell wall biosynthesis
MVFVIIPAYNEEKNIRKAIADVKKYADNIIVIDDGSTDNTYQVAKEAGKDIIILRHGINLGKGAALKTGCEAALKLGAKIIVLIDGDNQHNPADIPKLIKKLRDEKLDIVFGSRDFSKKIPPIRYLGNQYLLLATYLVSGIKLKDTLSGFRCFTAYAYRKIFWQSRDYAVETEIIVKVGKQKLKYAEVPIETIYHDNYKGVNIITGIKIFFKLIQFKFQ